MTDFSEVTGAIGAITGVIALIVSIKNYVSINAIKALDLRLEIGKAFDNLDIILSGIEGYLDEVHQSHLAVLSANGSLRSGEKVSFEKNLKEDKARLHTLIGKQPKRMTDYSRCKTSELEKVLAEIYTFNSQVSSLRDKYQKVFSSDEERRKELKVRRAQ